MKSIVREENLREDVLKYFQEYDIKHLNAKEVAATLFEYSDACKHGQKFDDHESFEMCMALGGDPVIAKELWAILAIYCFENLAYQMIGQHLQTKSNYDNVDDLFMSCCETITICARSYSFENKNEFQTYVHTALQNNLRHEQRMGLALPIPRHFRIEAAKLTDEMIKNPNKTNEQLAADLTMSIKTVNVLTRALRNRDAIPFSAPVDDMPNSDCLGKFLESEENVERDFMDREVDRILETKFFPVIADIFGPESAYVARVRTRSAWGEKKIGFREMEPGFCRYLTTVKNLHMLSNQYSQYEEMCKAVERTYATEGLPAVYDLLDTYDKSEADVVRALIDYSKTEAENIVENERENSECFENETYIRQRFTKVFPTNGTKMNKKELGKCRRLRRELRALGLEKLADAMIQNSGKLAQAESTAKRRVVSI